MRLLRRGAAKAPVAPARADAHDPVARTLRVQVEAARGEHWVTLAGELDMGGARVLEREVAGLPSGPCELILDLRGVTFMDSSGLRAILMLARRCEQRGVPFSLTYGVPCVMRVFEVCGLLARMSFLEPFPTADAGGDDRPGPAKRWGI